MFHLLADHVREGSRIGIECLIGLHVLKCYESEFKLKGYICVEVAQHKRIDEAAEDYQRRG